jgi:hypothetical protein
MVLMGQVEADRPGCLWRLHSLDGIGVGVNEQWPPDELHQIVGGTELLGPSKPEMGEAFVNCALLLPTALHRRQDRQRASVGDLKFLVTPFHVNSATDLHRAAGNGLHEVDHGSVLPQFPDHLSIGLVERTAQQFRQEFGDGPALVRGDQLRLAHQFPVKLDRHVVAF